VIVLIFNSVEISFIEYFKGFWLLFIGLYILSLLLILLEYIYGSVPSFLIVIGYLGFTIPYVHYTLANGEEIGFLKYFLISTYLESSVRNMFAVSYYVYLLFAFFVILVLYIMIIKIFNKKEIIWKLVSKTIQKN
ncbi:MAG: hypothetical protein ACK5HR_07435, partial [Mycoplasmatales bacterium]